ncbi:IS701 family transposase [Streptomyces boncukensis]|uniref:Transposase n=1 Tax=Streptomyces boncukensis TaxID=2711219 RepID=A0A6G4X4N0_9ACTN|nr:transposase [Streptomyces boncukensis]NGO71694.1 transposase [Streptomyces boncukensis]
MTSPGATMDEASSAVGLSMSLAAFSEEIFRSIKRADQRRWAHAYLAGLLRTPGKKSVRRLAHAVSTSPNAAQSLRQFVSTSSWDWETVLRELADWAVRHEPASALAIERLVIPKSGKRSVGVHRYFDPHSGRALNCQLGVGAFLTIGSTQVPVDWRLHLPAPWTEDAQLRRRARIPDAVQYRPLWAQVLDLVDALASRTATTGIPLVTDMSDAPHVGSFLRGLGQRGLDCVITLPHYLKVHPVDECGPFGPTLAGARECVSKTRAVESVPVTTVDGRQRNAQVRSALVRLPTGRAPGSAEGPFRVFTEVIRGDRHGPVWITNLTHLPLADVMSLTTLRASTGTTLCAMKRDLGLSDFEGRSFPGWHHHVTLVSAAHAYQRLAPLAPGSSARLPLRWVAPREGAEPTTATSAPGTQDAPSA